MSWPRDVGQEPLFYNGKLPHNPFNRNRRYWDLDSSPLYPFGYGLSYASFDMTDIGVPTETLAADGTLHVSVKVHNTSSVAGAQVVQLYTHQRAGSASRPARELKAFKKVTLGAGETQAVELSVPATDLAYWSPALHQWVLETGTFDVWVGADSTARLHGTFQLNGQGYARAVN